MRVFAYFRFGLLFLILGIMILGADRDAHAQKVNAYTMSTFSGGYSTIYGSSTLITSGDDGVSSGTAMPFAFKYDDAGAR